MDAMLAKMEEEYKEIVAEYKDLTDAQRRGEIVGKALEEVAQAMRESKAALDKMRIMLLGEDARFVDSDPRVCKGFATAAWQGRQVAHQRPMCSQIGQLCCAVLC